MALFIDEINQILNYYKGIADYFNKVVQTAPNGKLIYQQNHGCEQFLYRYEANGKVIRKGVNRNADIQQAMAKKEFASKALEILVPNIRALKEALDKQKPFDPDSILKSMDKAYLMLPESYFFDRSMLSTALNLDDADTFRIKRHEAWGKEPYKENWSRPERKTKRTSRGQYVRSKAELLIIEALYNYGIPMHYEEEFRKNGLLFVPDFTFKEKYGEFFFWEHMGMMDDPGYAKNNFAKLEDYYDADVIPGANLIITFSKGDDMNMGTIHAIIENEVIPRL